MPELVILFFREPFPGRISELRGPNCTKFGEIIGQSLALHNFVLDCRHVALF